MEAAIEFTVYKCYYGLVKPCTDGRYEWDYSEALQELNNEVSQLVKKKQLVFKYKNRIVPIRLPIEERDTGNIFEDYWDSVGIWCDIPWVDEDDFDSSYMEVSKCPDDFEPERVLWR